jgi:hypothetical protein
MTSFSFSWFAFANALRRCDFAAEISECARSLVGGLLRRDPSFATDSSLRRCFVALRFAVRNSVLRQSGRAACRPKWRKSAWSELFAHSSRHSAPVLLRGPAMKARNLAPYVSLPAS